MLLIKGQPGLCHRIRDVPLTAQSVGIALACQCGLRFCQLKRGGGGLMKGLRLPNRFDSG